MVAVRSGDIRRHAENEPRLGVCVCDRVTVSPAWRARPRSVHIQGIVAIPGPRTAFAMATPTTLFAPVSESWMRSEPTRMWKRANALCSLPLAGAHPRRQTHKNTHARWKLQFTFPQRSPGEQRGGCGRCSSLSGLRRVSQWRPLKSPLL